MAGGWCHWRVERSGRVPITGLVASGDWGPWSATGLLLSTRSFSASVGRTVHPRWRVQFGWSSNPVRFAVGVQGAFGALVDWSWGSEQAAWGGANWKGHVAVR